jgi:hypothetical protein
MGHDQPIIRVGHNLTILCFQTMFDKKSFSICFYRLVIRSGFVPGDLASLSGSGGRWAHGDSNSKGWHDTTNVRKEKVWRKRIHGCLRFCEGVNLRWCQTYAAISLYRYSPKRFNFLCSRTSRVQLYFFSYLFCTSPFTKFASSVLSETEAMHKHKVLLAAE